MSTLKKLLALTLALAMVLSVSVFAGNYSDDTYADAAQIHDDCKDAVEVMYALDIMVGDGTNFKPEQAIARKEMAKIIYVIMNGGKDDGAANYKGNSIFSDVPADEWYNGYVNYCAMTKKIQGYNGKFDPDATLTVAAAAKMLLTAIGYDAEAYGFVGPNWENNVLTVAHEAGLLNEVSTVLTGAAPRQWVAKMVYNALGAYCYKTIAAIPGNGVLGNIWYENDTLKPSEITNITTFGKKYLNVEIDTGYLVSTGNATLSGTAADCVFTDIGTVEDTGLTSADLGQQFSVVYKIDDGDKIALSVRNTGKSVVAEAYVKDVDYELTYGTTANNEDNVYEFTVGDLTGELTDEKIPVLVIDYDNSKKLEKQAVTATGYEDSDLIKAFKNVTTNDVVRAINTIIKASLNIDDCKFDVEVLPGESEVEFEARKASKNQYTFGESTYAVADNGFITKDDLKTGLGDDFDIVYDDELLVYAVGSNTNYTDMAEINEQLAVLVSADMNNVGGSNVYQVELLTIDGEIAWYDFDYKNAKTKGGDLAWTKIKPEWLDEDDQYAPNWGKLAIVHTNDDGEVWLEEVKTDDLGSLKTAAKDLVYVYDNGTKTVEGAVVAPNATLEVEAGKTTKYAGTRIADDTLFFAYFADDEEYAVITMADLEDGDYEGVTGITMLRESTYYTTTVGGYLIIGSADADAQTGYLWVTDIEGLQTDDDEKTIEVIFESGNDDTVVLDEKGVTPEQYGIYSYVVTEDGYKLTGINKYHGASKLDPVVEGDTIELWISKNNDLDLSDYDTVGLKVETSYREKADGEWEVTDTDVSFEEVEDVLELVATYEGLEADDDYTYIYNYRYVTDGAEDEMDLVVMVIEVYMEPNELAD